MRTLWISQGIRHCALHADNQVLGTFPSREAALTAAVTMAQESPGEYRVLLCHEHQGKRLDQVLFSAAVALVGLWGWLLLAAIAAVYQWLTK